MAAGDATNGVAAHDDAEADGDAEELLEGLGHTRAPWCKMQKE